MKAYDNTHTATIIHPIKTLGRLKDAFRSHRELPVYVWVHWQGDNDGEYIEVTRKSFLKSVGADVPFDNDGRHDDTQVKAEVRSGDGIYIG